MKKIIVSMILILLAFVLIACGQGETAAPETGGDKADTTPPSETTSGAPDVTAAVPAETTAAPETTAAVPDTTPATPETTTAVPETTTATPETTTAAPETTTAAPVTTTATPETTPPAPSGSEFTVPKDMNELRANVISYFNELANVKWRCKDTIDFRKSSVITPNLIYERGKTYYGIPYSSQPKKASLLEFTDYLTDSGIYTGPTEYTTIIGADCGSMRTAWAWGGAVSGVGMSFTDYEFFENEKETSGRVKGFIVPVGDYDFSHYSFSVPLTECVFPYNDLATMCKSYAELKSCDVIGKRWRLNTGGMTQHLRMTVEDATVVRNGKGEIIPDKSYIVYSEQTSTPTVVDGKNTTWNLNVKQSFKMLYNEGYVPMTSVCLASGEIAKPVMTILGGNTAEGIAASTRFSGTVQCNYNFFAAELTVTDESGNAVIHAKTYPYALSFDVSEMPVDKVPSDLPAGKYHYTLKATIGFGTKTLVSMDFAK